MGKAFFRGALLACATALAWGAAVPAGAQGQQALVIQGGTLIDGMGGAPVPNSVVVIQGNRITAVGRAGAVQVPAGAQVINANGKWVLPGLWDAQVNYSWFWGELFLNQGVTSAVDIGDGNEVSIAFRDAVNKGKAVGPRTYIGVGHMGGVRGFVATGLETPLSTRQDPKNADDARAIAKRMIAAGADMIMIHDGGYPLEVYQAAFDEAHKAGKLATCRCGGPKVGPKDGALAGADWFPHSTGIGAAIAKDGTRAQGELENYAAMDDAKAKDLLQVLIAHHVSLVPTIVHDSPSYPKNWTRYQDEALRGFSNPSLLAYYDKGFLAQMKGTLARTDPPDVHAVRAAGYRNMLRWNKMYDAAGGHVLAGGDTNGGKAPGFILHDEMEALEEAGIPRMHVIQGATEWTAEALHVQNKSGSLTPGKLADVLVVDADPLQDIANLRKIDTVVFDGKPVDRTFHAWFSTPFMNSGDNVDVVENLDWTVNWVKKGTAAAGRGGGGRGGAPDPEGPDPANSPQPGIETITPVMVTQGGPTTTLTLNGFNFVRRTRVLFDGISVPYRRVSPTQLQVTLDEELLKRGGRFDIVVQNPAPLAAPQWGDGTSNIAHLIVAFK